LQPPEYAGRAVLRPRLTDALDAGFADESRSFVMVSAPAGYGKTYLLAQWVDTMVARGTPAAWCSLDLDDRDPEVFLTTITAALVRAANGVDDRFSADLASLEPAMAPRAHSAFIGELTAAIEGFGRKLALVVDDAQVLEGTESAEEFIRIVRLLPVNLRIVLATRSPWSTHATRVDGRLLELTADSLSFTRAETTELFADERETDAAVEGIYSLAEGWPAALSLARLSVERREQSESVATLLDPTLFHDYLQHQVYNDFTARERSVILTAAVTPLITGDLVGVATGVVGSGEVLRELAVRNRMLSRVSTDQHGRTWYRVQPLFAEFLRETLRESEPDRLPWMAEQAAQWHSANGNPLLALRLASEAGVPGLVERILREGGYALVNEGHAADLLEFAPASSVHTSAGPFTRLMIAFAAVSAGKSDRAAEFIMTPTLTGLSADELMEWDWLYYLVQLRLALARGDTITSLSPGWPEETIAYIPDQLRAAVRLSRGLVEARAGNTGEAGTELRLALAIAENVDDLSSRLMSMVGLAAVALAEFDVRSTLQHSGAALALASRSTTQEFAGPRAVAHVLASWSSFELLDTAAARQHAQAAVSLAERQPDPELRAQAEQLYNTVLFDTLPYRRRIAQDFATNWPPAFLKNASNAAVIASLHFGLAMSSSLGERRWSERLLDGARQLIGEAHDWQVAYCLYLFTSGRDAAARSTLTPLLADDRSERLALSDIVAWSLDAVLEADAHNAFRAHSAIYRALERADETGGLFEVARPGARPVAMILSAGLDRFGPHEDTARRLLSLGVGESMLSSGPLTDRERQILFELKSLRTVDEIAHDLLLSVNTVKTHMRGIYRKLDARSRRQAIATAERLGLI
jgi:LuxR family maltose regulon positive regulatory protein